MTKTGRILFLMSDTGGGHRAAAEALSVALGKASPSLPLETTLVDFLHDGASPPFDQIGKLYRPTVDYAPLLWLGLFRLTSSRPAYRATLALLERVTSPGITRILQRYRTDLVVSVHPLANHVPVRCLRRFAPQTPFVTVVTDLATVHPLWFCPQVDYCIVPTEEAKQCALHAGVTPEKIRVAGLPIQPAFAALRPEQDRLRRQLGLIDDRLAILLVGGGEGMGHLDRYAIALDESGLPIQLVIIAGRNERLRRRLLQREWRTPAAVYGFVRNMPEIMAACDVIVTKAGPGTVSEALAAGRPILINGFIPGQEEGNVSYIVDGQAGAQVTTPGATVAQLRTWLQEGPQTLEALSRNALRLSHPYAAEEIARTLLEIV